MEKTLQKYPAYISQKELQQKIIDAKQDRDTVIDLVTHASLADLAASVIAAAVLCKETDGIIYDDAEDIIVKAPNAIEWAKKIERDIVDELSRKDK